MSEFNEFPNEISNKYEESDDGEPQDEPIRTLVPASINFRLAVAHAEMNSRRRNSMEDSHRILPKLHEYLPLHSYLAVYDGHGGRQIVDFIEEALENRVITELLEKDDADVIERITRAFLITDVESRKLNIVTSGCTAVVAMLFQTSPGSQRKLVVANVGDSRAILVSREVPTHYDQYEDQHDDNIDLSDGDEGASRKKKVNTGFYAHRLSYDHRADDPNEQKRISDAGGFVTRNRVLGILAVSRSFGDHGMKDFVTAAPYITETDISTTEETPILILACDGVWDVFTDQEASDLIMEKYLMDGPFEDAAELLVRAAIERGSSDNVSAVVCFL